MKRSNLCVPYNRSIKYTKYTLIDVQFNYDTPMESNSTDRLDIEDWRAYYVLLTTFAAVLSKSI